MTSPEPPPRPKHLSGGKKAVIALAATLALVLVAAVGFAGLWRYLRGPALGRFISNLQNGHIRGRLQIDSVEWSPRAIVDFFTDRPHEAFVYGLAIYDPAGRRVVWVPKATTKIRIASVVLRGNLLLSDLTVPDGAVVIELKDFGHKGEDGLPAKEIGLAAAFGAKVPKPPDPDGGGSIIAVERMDLRGLALTVRLPTVSIDAQGMTFPGGDLRFDGTKPPAESGAIGLTFDLSPTSKKVSLRIASLPAIPIEQLSIDSFRTRTNDSGTFVMTLSGRAAGARLNAHAALEDIYSFVPKLEVHARIEQAGRLASLLSQGWVGALQSDDDGAGPTLDVHLRGPFAALGGTVKASDFAVVHEGVPTVSRLALDLRWRPGAVALRSMTASVAGGRINATAELSLITLRGTAELKLAGLESAEIVSALAPPPPRKFHGRLVKPPPSGPVGTLSGELRLHTNLGRPEVDLDPISLTFTPRNVAGASPMQLVAHLGYRAHEVFVHALRLRADRLDVGVTGQAGPWSPGAATSPTRAAAAGPRVALDAHWSIQEAERFVRGVAGLAGGAADALRTVHLAETHGSAHLTAKLPTSPPKSTAPSGAKRRVPSSPSIARSLLGSLRLGAELEASALGAMGVELDQLAASLRFENGLLSLPELDAALLGGHIRGAAAMRLLEPPRARTAPPQGPWVKLHTEGTDLDVERLLSMIEAVQRASSPLRVATALPSATGKLRFEASMEGPLPRDVTALPPTLGAELSLRSTALTIADLPLELTALVSLSDGALLIRRVAVNTTLGPLLPASSLALRGSYVASTRALDLHLLVQGIPLGALPLGNGQGAGMGIGLAGTASAQLDVGGTLALPSLSGRIDVRGARLLDLAGDAALTISTERTEAAAHPTDTILIAGELLGYFKLAARVQLVPTLAIKATLAFEKLPIASLLPAGTPKTVRGEVSGRAELDLVPSRLQPLRAELYIDQLRAELHAVAMASQGPLVLTNSTPIDLVFDGVKLLLAKPATLHLPAGDFTLAGSVSTAPIDNQLAVALVGSVDLAVLRYLFKTVLDDARGRVVANVQVAGTLSRPRLRGTITLRDARLRPIGSQLDVLLPRGDIALDDEQIQLKGVEAIYDGATLEASGRVGIHRFVPRELNLQLAGRLSMAVLPVLAPQNFSEARGQLALTLHAEGTVSDPRLTGSVVVSPAFPIKLGVRGVRRELLVRSGRVDLTNNELKLTALRAKVDDGDLLVDGRLTLEELRPVAIDLTATARGVPNRIPGVLDLEIDADRLHLEGDRNQLKLSGDVVLVEGRYKEDFDLVRSLFLSPRTHEEAPPVWKGVPLLESMKLALSVDTAGAFSIQNNLAKIDLTGSLDVVGTLAEPRLNGSVRAVAGTFHIPLLRGDYTVQRGEITFNKAREIPTETPSILIAGETTYVDRTEVEHLITLTLKTREGRGISELGFEMSSNTGLNTAQCLALLSTGRTTDQLRNQLRGSPSASGSAWTGAAGVSNEFAKQLSGDIISLLVEDPIKKITRFDRFRVELGTESLDVRVGKRLSRQILVTGEARYGLVVGSGYNVMVDFKLTDSLFLQGQATATQSTTPYGPDTDRQRLQLKYRIKIK